MRKINTLFLSMQPAVLGALYNHFKHSPLILACFDDYSNLVSLLNEKKFKTIVFDDGSLSKNEFEIMFNIISNSNIPRVLFTYETERQYLSFFIQNKIEGLVSKKEKLDKLQEAIINIYNSKKYYSEKIINYLVAENKDDNIMLQLLTSREIEVMNRIRKGMRNKDIAKELFISVKTIESHIENIKKKLGLSTVKELRRTRLQQFPYKFTYKK